MWVKAASRYHQWKAVDGIGDFEHYLGRLICTECKYVASCYSSGMDCLYVFLCICWSLL